jgi:hypothetical protein
MAQGDSSMITQVIPKNTRSMLEFVSSLHTASNVVDDAAVVPEEDYPTEVTNAAEVTNVIDLIDGERGGATQVIVPSKSRSVVLVETGRVPTVTPSPSPGLVGSLAAPVAASSTSNEYLRRESAAARILNELLTEGDWPCHWECPMSLADTKAAMASRLSSVRNNENYLKMKAQLSGQLPLDDSSSGP